MQNPGFSQKNEFREAIVSHKKDINVLNTIHCKSVCFYLTVFYKEKQLTEDTQSNKAYISIILETCPSLLHQSLPCPLRVDSSGRDSSHYLPHQPRHRLISLLLLPISASIYDCHTCCLITQTQNLFCVRWYEAFFFLHNLGYLSQMCHSDSTLCDISEAKISLPDHWYLSKNRMGVTSLSVLAGSGEADRLR